MREPPSSVHVVASVAKDVGGPAYSVPALVEALARCGGASALRTVSGPADDNPYVSVIASRHPPRGPLGGLLRCSPDLSRALRSDAESGAVLHAHGVWLMPNVYPSWIKTRTPTAVRLVHSPRGMLAREALEISAWKKRPFWLLMQRKALAAADCLHATAASEYDEIRAAGLTNPVAIIPNGVDLPDLAGAPKIDGDERTVLSLGRIHPKKGLDRLVRAWSFIEAEFPNSRLRIIGPGELDHDRELLALARSCGARRLTIEGPIYGAAEKLNCYRAADLFVLPSLNENFAMAVAEALAAELPVIATRGAPWAGLDAHRCGWWIDHGVDPLVAHLRAALATPRDVLRAMGRRGRLWMKQEFGWDRVASEMIDVYAWLRDGGEPPPTVRPR